MATDPIVYHDPEQRSGLSLTVQTFDTSGATLSALALTESPVSSGRYIRTNALLIADSLTAVEHDYVIADSVGNNLAYGLIDWNGTTANSTTISYIPPSKTEIGTYIFGHSTWGQLYGAVLRVEVDTQAIEAVANQFVFTVANQVDANVQSINDTPITGNGVSGTEWGP